MPPQPSIIAVQQMRRFFHSCGRPVLARSCFRRQMQLVPEADPEIEPRFGGADNGLKNPGNLGKPKVHCQRHCSRITLAPLQERIVSARSWCTNFGGLGMRRTFLIALHRSSPVYLTICGNNSARMADIRPQTSSVAVRRSNLDRVQIQTGIRAPK